MEYLGAEFDKRVRAITDAKLSQLTIAVVINNLYLIKLRHVPFFAVVPFEVTFSKDGISPIGIRLFDNIKEALAVIRQKSNAN